MHPNIGKYGEHRQWSPGVLIPASVNIWSDCTDKNQKNIDVTRKHRNIRIDIRRCIPMLGNIWLSNCIDTSEKYRYNVKHLNMMQPNIVQYRPTSALTVWCLRAVLFVLFQLPGVVEAAELVPVVLQGHPHAPAFADAQTIAVGVRQVESSDGGRHCWSLTGGDLGGEGVG